MDGLNVEGQRPGYSEPVTANLSSSRLIRIVLINLLILGMGLFTIELIFGNWFSKSKSSNLYLLKNVKWSYDVSSSYQTDHLVTYIRDKYGLRGRYDSPASIDILTIGGSTTDQRYVSEGETWQDVLSDELSKRCKRKISVVNAGIDGQSTYGHIRNFDWWFPEIPNLTPKYCLFLIGINDFAVGPTNRADDLSHSSTGLLKQMIRDNSALFRVYRTLKGIYLASDVKLAYRHNHRDLSTWTNKQIIKDHLAMMADRISGYRERVSELVRRTRKLGSHPIFVTQSRNLFRKVDGNLLGVESQMLGQGIEGTGCDYYHMQRLLNEAAMMVAQKEGATVIDMASELIPEEGDLYDSCHNTPKGAIRIGRYLAHKLDYILCPSPKEATSAISNRQENPFR